MKPLYSFDNDIMEMMAKVFAKDVDEALKLLRDSGFPELPITYAFAISSSYDARGIVFKTRLTAGAVTVRETAEIPVDIVCDLSKKPVFNERISKILADLAVKFAVAFAKD